MKGRLVNFAEQESHLFAMQAWKDSFLRPLYAFLTFLGITANHITSLCYLLALLPLWYTEPRFVLALVATDLFLDLFDGGLARYQGRATEGGVLFDAMRDALFVSTSTYSFAVAGIIPFSHAYAYGLLYPLSSTYKFVSQSMGIPGSFNVRPRLFVYGAVLFYVMTEKNVTPIVTLIAGILLALELLWKFSKITKSMSEHGQRA